MSIICYITKSVFTIIGIVNIKLHKANNEFDHCPLPVANKCHLVYHYSMRIIIPFSKPLVYVFIPILPLSYIFFQFVPPKPEKSLIIFIIMPVKSVFAIIPLNVLMQLAEIKSLHMTQNGS